MEAKRGLHFGEGTRKGHLCLLWKSGDIHLEMCLEGEQEMVNGKMPKKGMSLGRPQPLLGVGGGDGRHIQ